MRDRSQSSGELARLSDRGQRSGRPELEANTAVGKAWVLDSAGLEGFKVSVRFTGKSSPRQGKPLYPSRVRPSTAAK